ncbi:CDP-diacylglycerol--serine O-phosphatidyltransferase [Ornithinibacillus bavariensis]|uniref:CDP-diacylglycerol--serine O-phosphatidyltransferase n=1 Tax=Ornithinibacillus bavariensis TaxID=545502 RepID=A0A919X7S2_9BACI|nr:CDP-diacylglycerol--serine O-phosphatidyltransferase [Ornithinibacillus bavariensis]GIO27546.1 CDP-diacylglycerol--serine O-phosphatidyltransferase [Ornithinibacillus bavariensis]
MFLVKNFYYTKIKSQLANIITLMNLEFGIISIILMAKGSFHLSLLFIFLAVFFDRFDGMVARKLNIESDFGKELDSLSDLVSFGVAPGLLVYMTILNKLPGVGLSLIVIYILCGAIRLARYNVKEFDGAFYGIPITVAGFLMAFSVLFSNHLPIMFYVILTSILAVLMVSNIRIQKM